MPQSDGQEDCGCGRRGQKVVSTNLAEAGSKSKGASALGVALALGEIREGDSSNEAICNNWGLYSKVAFTSAGNNRLPVVVLWGNSLRAVSKFKIGSGIMQDTLDIAGAKDAFRGRRDKYCAGFPLRIGNA